MDKSEEKGFYNLETEDSIRIFIKHLKQNVAVIRMIGEINNYNYQYCQREINKVIDKSYDHLVFDVSQINFATTAICRLFPALHSCIQSSQRKMIIASISPKILEIFQLLGYKDKFRFVDSIEEALRELKTSSFPK